MLRKVLALASVLLTLGFVPSGFGYQDGAAFAQTADITPPDAESSAGPSAGTSYVGPTQILFADADTMFVLRSKEWWSDNVREQEKLLLHNLRMRYWLAH